MADLRIDGLPAVLAGRTLTVTFGAGGEVFRHEDKDNDLLVVQWFAANVDEGHRDPFLRFKQVSQEVDLSAAAFERLVSAGRAALGGGS